VDYGGWLYPNVYLVNYGPTGNYKTSSMRRGLNLVEHHHQQQPVKILQGIGSAEALGDWMTQPDEGPKVSHLIFLEEMAELLDRSNWNGSTLLSFLTTTFDAPSTYEAKYRKNPVFVVDPTPSLVAGTTPEWFWQSFRPNNMRGGFGNRLFFLTGKAKKGVALPSRPDPNVLALVQAHLGRLTTLPAESVELLFEPEALKRWVEFFNHWEAVTSSFPELTRCATKRILAYILKLCMVYACFDRTVPTITREQLDAAIAVGEYGARCADKLMEQNQQRETVQGKCEARILHELQKCDLTGSKIHRRLGGHYPAKQFWPVLEALVRVGVVEVVDWTTRGKPVYGRRDRKRP
jgi:hypothetical protein